MVHGLAAKGVGRAQAILGPLRSHHHLIQGERAYGHKDDQTVKVTGCVQFQGCIYIAQTAGLQHIAATLHVFEKELPVRSADRPEIILPETEHDSDEGVPAVSVQHPARHTAACRSGLTQNRQEQRQYDQCPAHCLGVNLFSP